MKNRLQYISLIMRNTLGILIFLELILCGIYNYKDEKTYGHYIDLKIESNVHENMKTASIKKMYYEYKALDMQWSAYTHFRPKLFNGAYNTINNLGQRKTISRKVNNLPVIKIFCFGGSTMYGIGATDETTIPSLLAEMLAKKLPNKSFDITNFGIPGYTRNMETIQLQREIIHGNIPDIVIFYDGVNEVLSAFQNENIELPWAASKRHIEFNTAKNYSKRFMLFLNSSYTNRFLTYLRKKTINSSSNSNKNLMKLSKDISFNYRQNITLLESLGKHYSFDVINYLQPTIFTKEKLSKFEIHMKKNESSLKNLYNETYSQILKDTILQKNTSYRNISTLFNPYSQTIFTDFCHTEEKGNKIIADAFLEDIINTLRD